MALNDIAKGSCFITKRSVCVEVNEACLNAFAILQIEKKKTTLLRVELADGTVVVDPVYVECTCDCLDVIPCNRCTSYVVFPEYYDTDEFIVNNGATSLGTFSDGVDALNIAWHEYLVALEHENFEAEVVVTDLGLLFTFTSCDDQIYGGTYIQRVNSEIEGCNTCGFETHTLIITDYPSYAAGDIFFVVDFFDGSDNLANRATLQEIEDILIAFFLEIDVAYESVEVSGAIDGDVTLTFCTPSEAINSWFSTDEQAGSWFLVLDNGDATIQTLQTSGECVDFVSTCPCEDCTYTASTLIKENGAIYFNNVLLQTWNGDETALAAAFLAAVSPFYEAYGLAAPTVGVEFFSVSDLDGNLTISFTGCKLPESVTNYAPFNIFAFKTFVSGRFTSACNTCECVWTTTIPNFGSYGTVLFNVAGSPSFDLQSAISLAELQSYIETELNIAGIEHEVALVSGVVYDAGWTGDLVISICSSDEDFFSILDSEDTPQGVYVDADGTIFLFERADVDPCDCGPYCLYELALTSEDSLVGHDLSINGNVIWTFESGDFDVNDYIIEASALSILTALESYITAEFTVVDLPDSVNCAPSDWCQNNIHLHIRNITDDPSDAELQVSFAACSIPGVEFDSPLTLEISGGVILALNNEDGQGTGYTIGDILTLTGGNNNATVEVVSISGGISSAVPNVAGSGYTVNDQLTDTSGNADGILNVDSIDGFGGVTGLSVVTPGIGYSTSTDHILTGGTGDGLATANIIVSSGIITSFNIVDGGTGYIVANDIPTTGGTGEGAEFNIEAVSDSISTTIETIDCAENINGISD